MKKLLVALVLMGVTINGKAVRLDNDSIDYSNEPVVTNFEDNLDSLLNLWYMNNRVYDTFSADEASIESFSKTVRTNLPDSVFISRLAKIPTTVKLSYNPIVRNHIEFYLSQRKDKVEQMLGLANYYFPIFDDIFDYHKVPNEMKYMSIIESALNPKAFSRTRAVGLWQFMYGTGKLYGLEVNSLVDERRDTWKSTHAACRYVSDLYKIYGDWILVIAAYNCGPGNVNKAIRRSGGHRNYWEIYNYLPRETRGHVPAFIAATYIMNYYQEHNLKPVASAMPPAADTVVINRNLHLQQVAEVINIPLDQLRDINPQYTTDIIPASSKPYPLALPVESVTKYIDFEAKIFAYKDSMFLKRDYLTKTPGDRSGGESYATTGKGTRIHYKVRSGDNLGAIADRYRVNVSQLKAWNGLHRNSIRAGQRLVIYSNHKTKTQSETTSPDSKVEVAKIPGDYVVYTVKSGDTLWDIAQRYPGVSDNDIKKWNNLDGSKLTPGQKIKILRN